MSSLRAILELVFGDLAAAGVEGLLIGGFAVNYYGYTRNTLDVDFLVVADQIGPVEACMQRAGFINIERRENVHFFSHPASSWRVDFLKVAQETMRPLLQRAVKARVHEADVLLPSLPDLLAMKLHALANDPARRLGKDLPDIAWLCILNQLDAEQILRPLCKKYATPELERMIFEHLQALEA